MRSISVELMDNFYVYTGIVKGRIFERYRRTTDLQLQVLGLDFYNVRPIK